MTLDRNGNLEIGLKLFGKAASRFDFLIMGCTIACLNQEGTEPLARLLFMMREIVGPTNPTNTSFNRHVEKLSKGDIQ